jgi:RNA-directed DNA polymerase
MLRSRATALITVRRVTELNTDRKTAGVDGQVIVTVPGKAFLAERVRLRRHACRPVPIKRVYVPKANGKRETGNGKRPSAGIPVILDRAPTAG